MSEKKLISLEQGDVNIDSVVSDLLKNVPKQEREEVVLPSGATFYKYTRPDGKVLIKPITFEDEKVVASLKDKKKMLDTFLSRCVDGVDIADLLPRDKVFLIIKLRALSVSPTYSFTVTCASEKCQAKQVVDINLNEDFPIIMAEPPIEEISDVELPVAKINVKVKRLKAKDMSDNLGDIFKNMWRFIVSIQGNSNRAVISQVLDKLPRTDVAKILETMMPTNYGLQTEFVFKCSKCEDEHLTELVLDENFFSVS